MSNGSKPAATGVKQEESSNALIQSIDLLEISTTNQLNKQFEINIMGCMTDCHFYIPDATADNTGFAFSSAYHFAKNSKDNKEICALIGSMLCSVVPGLKNAVLEALNLTGINPLFVSLPSQARQNSIDDLKISPLDWPSILVIFGYCIMLLIELPSGGQYGNYCSTLSDRIRLLQAVVGCDPSKILGLPFHFEKAYAISTMLGSSDLRDTVKQFMKNCSNHPNSQIRNMCAYLSDFADS